MCISPTLIKNPNYHAKGRYSFLKDTVSPYIKVPCGYCSECLHSKQLSLVQRCMTESLSGYPFFCTLTYNQQSLPVLTTSDGFDIRFADFSDVTNMIKRLRKDFAFGRNFRYLAVSELGSKRARPHFHLLFFVEKYPNDTVYTPLNLEAKLYKTVLSYWQRNYGSRRKPVYKPLCTYVHKIICGKIKTTYDLHFVQNSSLNGTSSDVHFYVTKYMLKPSKHVSNLQSALKLNLSPEEYKDTWNKVKPRWVASLNFGFGVYGLQAKKLPHAERLIYLRNTDAFKVVRDSISRSAKVSDYPAFYDPENGKPLPLSRYWKSFGNLYTEQDALTFFYKNPNQFEDNVSIDERPITSKLKAIESLSRQQSQIENNEDIFTTLI